MGCWVRRSTTNITHQQYFLVERCAPANEPCLAGEDHGSSKCGQHHPPPAFISLLNHPRQRKNHGLVWVILNCVNCKQVSAKSHQHDINMKCVQNHHPPTYFSVLKAAGCAGGGGWGQKIYQFVCIIEFKQVGENNQHHDPNNAYNSTNTTNIAFSSHALQRKILEIQQKCVSVCAARRGAGQHENRGLRWVILNRAKNHQHQINIKCVRKHHPPTFISWLKAMRWMRRQGGGQNKAQPPERGIPPSFHATRRYTKIHIGFCLRFSTLIGQISCVPLFGAGPRR